MVGVLLVGTVVVSVVVGEATQSRVSGAVEIDADDIGGVVTSIEGPEPGVWVVAETTALPTGFIKIVVTDDDGRYLLPDLPDVPYRVFVRGYGLVDSVPVEARPGRALDLRASVAPTPAAAAEYYPANYWYSLIELPDPSEFPINVSTPPEKDPTADENDEVNAMLDVWSGMNNQQQWISTMKQGCELCHQMGTKITRDLSRMEDDFGSSIEAWDHRVQGFGMSPMLDLFDRQRALEMFADWSDRIAAGELPPTPPRPSGVERNVVISMWDWGTPRSIVHDEIASDKRHPTVNANGRVYGADSGNNWLVWVDPATHTAGEVTIPTRQDNVPTGAHNPMIDDAGRVWVTAAVRRGPGPEFCTDDDTNRFASYFPMSRVNGKQVSIYDPASDAWTLVDTCFNTHHLQLAHDADNTMFFSGVGSQVFGWVNSRVLFETGDAEEAQGWCPAYLDSDGNGKIDPRVDRRVKVDGYGAIVNPVDGSVWFATTGVPGTLTRISLGENPPESCMAEMYEPPFDNPEAPGVFGFTPRGIDVDRNGIIWTALGGSGHLASFDRSRCRVLNGPTATGQHCVEGWTLHVTPGPWMKGAVAEGSADFHYYNWVDQFNVLGLGHDVPIVNGTDSDSLLAFLPDSGDWVVMRVPYPMGFYSRGLDGRIDDPDAGWKGRGIWANYGEVNLSHLETGPGSRSKAVKFQIRPDPLAK